jgi:uncharacterized coiled-coil protein SlyX
MAEYQNALELYRKNYLDYKLTGNAAYKTAYTNAQEWIELYLRNLEQTVTKGASSIDKFVKDYAQTNPELTSMRDQLRVIQQEGPQLQDAYETGQRANEAPPPPSNTHHYVKGAIVAGLVVLALVLRR